jgi:hypothetical protein
LGKTSIRLFAFASCAEKPGGCSGPCEFRGRFNSHAAAEKVDGAGDVDRHNIVSVSENFEDASGIVPRESVGDAIQGTFFAVQLYAGFFGLSQDEDELVSISGLVEGGVDPLCCLLEVF